LSAAPAADRAPRRPATAGERILFAFGPEARIVEQCHAAAFGARVAVVDAPSGGSLRRCLVSLPQDGLLTQQSAMNLAHPERLVFAYEQAMALAVALPPRPRRALLLGLGGGAMVRFLAAYFPDCALTIIEHDPAILRLARRHFHVTQPVELADAYEAVRYAEARYDAILVDLYGGRGFNGPPLEFWDHCAAALEPQGCLAINWADARDKALYEIHARRAARAGRAFFVAPRGFKDNVVQLCVAAPGIDAAALRAAATALARRQRRKSILERGAVLDGFP
jgi:spermidine synthase